MTPLAIFVLGTLVTSALVSVWRVLRDGPLADRVTGFDLLLLAIVGAVAVNAAATQQTEHVELPMIVGLLGFLGTVTAATYLRGQR